MHFDFKGPTNAKIIILEYNLLYLITFVFFHQTATKIIKHIFYAKTGKLFTKQFVADSFF